MAWKVRCVGSTIVNGFPEGPWDVVDLVTGIPAQHCQFQGQADQLCEVLNELEVLKQDYLDDTHTSLVIRSERDALRVEVGELHAELSQMKARVRKALS
jgi:hypothetical protein